MKRKILILGLIISALTWADNLENRSQGIEIPLVFDSKLTVSQEKKLELLKEDLKKEIEPLELIIEEKDVAIKKELLSDKFNFEEIEKLLREKAEVEGQIELLTLKNKVEIEDKVGIIVTFDAKKENKSGKESINNKAPNNQNEELKNDKHFDKENMDFAKLDKEMILKEKFSLTKKQEKELKSMQNKYNEIIEILKLTEKEKEIGIQKEMLGDTRNWGKVEDLIKGKLLIISQIEFNQIKGEKEITEKFGKEFSLETDLNKKEKL